MQKRFVWILVAALIGFASAQTPPVTKVGTLLSYTGALAEFGPAMSNGVQLAVDELNAAATEVFGGPIVEVIAEDDATSASQGVDRARKLINADGVVAIIGALSSGVTVAVAESVAIPSSTVVISPASTSPLLTLLPDDGRFILRTTASDTLQGMVGGMLARGEIVDGNSFETAGIVYVNNPYGQGLAEAFTNAFEARGGKVVASVAHPDEPQPTYAAMLEELLAGNPEVVLAISYPGQATVYMTEARDLYGFTNWQYTDGTQSLEIIEAMGADDVEGQYGTSAGADPNWGGWVTFADNYRDSFGEAPPLPYIDTSYDAMIAIGLAIAKAYVDEVEINSVNVADRLREVSNGPGETIGVGDYTRAMELIKAGEAIDFSGAAGEVDFDEFGDVVTPIEVWQYTGGDIEPVTVVSGADIPAE